MRCLIEACDSLHSHLLTSEKLKDKLKKRFSR
jgi:hypothetical protein